MFNITDVKIYPFDSGESPAGIKAYADITLEDSLVLKGIKVIQGKSGGLFIGFPSRKGKGDTYQDLVIPKTIEVRNYIRERVLEAFKNHV